MLKKILAALIIALLVSSIFFSSIVKSSASGNQIFWGAWVGTEDRMPLQTIQTFENQVGKGISIWNWIQWWIDVPDSTHDPNFNFEWMNECRNHGAIPMISWTPSPIFISERYEGYDDVLNGKFDAYLDHWGKDSASWGHPYFVRFYWEFNGDWDPPKTITPWNHGETPEKFVAMWQYVVNRVRAAGGTQISWIWCPAQLMESVNKLKTVYPGNQYVDWVGTDVYTTLEHAQTYLNTIRTVAPNKPVMLPEIGYLSGEQTTEWKNILNNGLPNEYSYIKGICLWQDSAEATTGLTVLDQTDLPVFKNGISSNYYASNDYANLNTSPLKALNATNPPTNLPLPSSKIEINPSSAVNLTSAAVLLVVLAIIGIVAAIALLKRKP